MVKKGTMLKDKAGEYTLDDDLSLDCFGWISLQMLLQNPRIFETPNNVLTPDNIFDGKAYDEYGWVHIRQMSSSTLGINGNEYTIWQKGSDGILNHIFRLFNEEYADGGAEFIHLKAVAFKMLFVEMLADKEHLGVFVSEYKTVLESVIEYLGLNRIRLAEIKAYYRGLMQL